MEIIRLTETDLDTAVRRTTEVLTQGGIVLYPTDTTYGLGVDATNQEALKRLKQLKGRDAAKPISILVKDRDMIRTYGIMNEQAQSLIARFLPGPLTLVLGATDKVLKELNALGEIGVRIPNEPFCTLLMQRYPNPVTATSANIAGREAERNIDQILSQFGPAQEEIALVIDAGERGNASSTVVSCVSDIPVILREGALTKEELW